MLIDPDASYAHNWIFLLEKMTDKFFTTFLKVEQ